jgi:hypothetical protein
VFCLDLAFCSRAERKRRIAEPGESASSGAVLQLVSGRTLPAVLERHILNFLVVEDACELAPLSKAGRALVCSYLESASSLTFAGYFRTKYMPTFDLKQLVQKIVRLRKLRVLTRQHALVERIVYKIIADNASTLEFVDIPSARAVTQAAKMCFNLREFRMDRQSWSPIVPDLAASCPNLETVAFERDQTGDVGAIQGLSLSFCFLIG